MRRQLPKILAFSGSARAQSYNARLAALLAKTAALGDAEVTLLSLADYPLPLYDGDLEASSGVPVVAERLKALMLAHQGIFIASPEYNQSVSPLLKNTLDWLSRIKAASDASLWTGRVFAIGSASPGHFGGVRGLLHLRQILELGLGARVLSEQAIISNATNAFTPMGDLADERAAGSVGRLARRLVEEAGHFI